VPISNARCLARAIPGATLKVVRAAGHLLLIDEATTVGRLIAGFLEEGHHGS
jgi:pimeloyl-ACP methyl ester carboxylesterase